MIVYVFSRRFWKGVLAGLPGFSMCLQGGWGTDEVRRGGYTISVWVRWHLLGANSPSNTQFLLLNAIKWSRIDIKGPKCVK